MARLGRTAIVVLGLAAAGAVAGAACALIALAPIALQRIVRPTPDDLYVALSDVVPWAMAIGAALGATLGPLLALSLLRTVPLRRVILQPTLGTAVGALLGWLVAFERWVPGVTPILTGSLGGMLIAGLLLRVRAGRHREPAT